MNNYASLNGVAGAAAEIVELTARHQVENRRAKVIPGHKVPPSLVAGIRGRYELVDDATQAAVVDLLRGGYRIATWESWLASHLTRHPQDAVTLQVLERDFKSASTGGTQFQRDNYGSDFNWQMDHNKADYSVQHAQEHEK